MLTFFIDVKIFHTATIGVAEDVLLRKEPNVPGNVQTQGLKSRNASVPEEDAGTC